MPIINISSLDQEGIDVFSQLTEAQLRHHKDIRDGLFIAESPKVIRIALSKGYEPIALLCEEKHIIGDAANVVKSVGDIPIYTGNRQLLANLTGYTLTRGVLCAMKRKPCIAIDGVCKYAKRIVVINGVVDSTNIGAIFRDAAALGIDGVLLTTNSCDPLNRRAIRVSMGSVFLIPWTWIDKPISSLHAWGFKNVAMALTEDSIPIDSPKFKQIDKLAIILGTEGDGLPYSTIAESDYVARIPMHNCVDSLNVASAAAIAFWQLRK